jgi:trk system potassium uptake protein TrkH
MTGFDAVVHAFSTMGLGGFSTHDASFGHFNSPAIEFVAIVFMLLAGMNFATHFQALRLGSMAPYRADVEARWFLVVAGVSVLLITGFLLYHRVYPDFLTALRFSAFNVVSIATTTGYASTDYNLWPAFAPLWMLMLSSFATSSGSTGGGIKMVRALILYKLVYRELMQSMHPRAVLVEKLGGRPLPTQVLYSVLVFGFLYLSSLLVVTMVLAASGLDLVSAFTATVATLNNTGPGLNQVGPATTYEVLTDFQTWVCAFAMILGRLELFAVLLVFMPVFWRN